MLTYIFLGPITVTLIFQNFLCISHKGFKYDNVKLYNDSIETKMGMMRNLSAIRIPITAHSHIHSIR